MKKSSFLFWKVNRKNGPTWFIIAYRDFSVVFFDNHFDNRQANPWTSNLIRVWFIFTVKSFENFSPIFPSNFLPLIGDT